MIDFSKLAFNPEIITKESLEFFEKYINTPSPVGFEYTSQKLWLDYLKPLVDTHYVDTYGTAVAIINPDSPYKVVIEAHCDEIAWYVHYISSEGYIYVKKNGGSDPAIAPSKTVSIFTENGPVKGIFGWPAIHVRDEEKAPTLKTIFIDCGMTKDELVKAGVEIGNVVTFDDELMLLGSSNIVGKALDNRVGSYMISQVARLLKENKKELPFGLYIVNSVQEEIGLRGAQMIANRIKPNVAIITDVTHDTQSPLYDKKIQGDISCGKGPVLTIAPAVQNNLLKMIVDTAKSKEIPIQKKVSSSSTGTDTDSFAFSGMGVASALISLPQKYMHTTTEFVNISDVENVIKLMYEFIIQLPNEHDFRYLK